jgi:hypothetical protein
MRVNVQYSIELEDFVKEVTNLIDSTVRDFCLTHEVIDICTNLKQDGNVNKATEHLEKILKGIKKVDTRLEDCLQLLKGYQVALFSPLKKEDQKLIENVEFNLNNDTE